MKKGREDEKRANQRTRQSFVEACFFGSLLNESEKMGDFILDALDCACAQDLNVLRADGWDWNAPGDTHSGTTP
jgi:hypothetical protein